VVEKAELLKTFPMLRKKVKGREEDRMLVEELRSDFLSARHCRRRDRN
jgi:hypothetical protein